MIRVAVSKFSKWPITVLGSERPGFPDLVVPPDPKRQLLAALSPRTTWPGGQRHRRLPTPSNTKRILEILNGGHSVGREIQWTRHPACTKTLIEGGTWHVTNL